MDIKILILLTCLTHFYLGFLVFKRGWRKKANLGFCMFVLSLALWSLAFYFYEHPFFLSSLIWIKTIYLIVFFMIFSLVYFSYYFPVKSIKSPFLPLALYSILAIPQIWILLFTDLWIENVVHKSWGVATILGPAYILPSIFWSLFSLLVFIKWFKIYRRIKGLGKMQLRFIFSGTVLFIILTIIVDAIIPFITGESRYFWLSPMFSLFLAGSVAYAMVRYRLMDIRIIIKRGVIHFFSIFSFLSLFLIVFIAINKYFFNESISIQRLILGSVIIVPALFLYRKFLSFFESFFNRYLFKTVYTAQQAIEELTKKTTTIIELSKLIDAIIDTIMKAMGLNRVGILLAEKVVEKINGDNKDGKRNKERHVNFYRIAKTIGFNETNGISLVKDNFLISYLQKIKKAVVCEELELMIRDADDETEQKHLSELKKNMLKIEAGVCLPLFVQKKLISIIVLGYKISNEAYTQEDLQLLETLANQASIALANAKLYKEVDEAHKQAENFNVILQKKVDEATKELQEKNANLKELLHMKSEFLTVASHQLRTPTSIVRGMLSMLAEEGDNMEPEQKKQFIEQSYQSINHLERIVHDLLSATELEGGKMQFTQEPVHLEEFVEKIIKERKPNADKKGLRLEFIKPEKVPLALVDRFKVEEIVANLLDNAINYTEKGGVTVSLGSDSKRVFFKVADTGIGITKEDRKHLFERLKRGKNVARIHPNGSGLGLYIVKGIVQGLKGEIKVESAGKNKGTAFTVYFPKAMSQ